MMMMMMMMYHWKDHPHHYAFRMGNDGVLLRGKRRLWRRLMTMMLLIILMPMMQRSWIMVIAEDGGDVVPCLFSLRHPFRWNIYPLAVTGGAAKTTNEEKCCYWVNKNQNIVYDYFSNVLKTSIGYQASWLLHASWLGWMVYFWWRRDVGRRCLWSCRV